MIISCWCTHSIQQFHFFPVRNEICMAGHYNRFSHTNSNKVKTCWTRQELFLTHIHQKTKALILRVTLALSKMMISLTQQYTPDCRYTLPTSYTFTTTIFNLTANLRKLLMRSENLTESEISKTPLPCKWLELQPRSMTLSHQISKKNGSLWWTTRLIKSYLL